MDRYADKESIIFSIIYNQGGWTQRGIYVIIFNKKIILIPLPMTQKYKDKHF